MTDNNTDETAENSNLSRRTALALMGTSAVGGAAATSAFSQLTADRPVEVQVVDSGADSELSANDTGSKLEITNNHNEKINASINASEFSNVSVVGLNGTNTNIRTTSESWELSNLNSSETVAVEFAYDNTAKTVDFNVEAFSGTSGFSIGSDQAVSVAKSDIPSSAVLHHEMNEGTGTRLGDEFDNAAGTLDGSWISDSDAYGGNKIYLNKDNSDSVDIGYYNSNHDYFAGAITIEPDTNDRGRNNIASDEENDAYILRIDGDLFFYVYNGSGYSGVSTSPPSTGTKSRVGFKYDGSQQKIFIDGSQAASGSESNSLTSVGTNSLGYRATKNDRYFDGKLDNFIFFAASTASDLPSDSWFTTDYNNQPWS